MEVMTLTSPEQTNKSLDRGVDLWYNIHMTKTITGGFKNPIPPRTPNDYSHYCWFVYQFTQPNGKTCGVRELFPPVGRNDTYGGKTDTEIRSLAFERLNKLQKENGVQNVSVEMIS